MDRWRNIPLGNRFTKCMIVTCVTAWVPFNFPMFTPFLHRVGNTALNIIEMNEVDKIKVM